MATLLLKLDGIDADGAARAERLLRGMAGVFGVVVSTAEGCAEVDFEDDEGDVDDILDQLRAEGFHPRLSG